MNDLTHKIDEHVTRPGDDWNDKPELAQAALMGQAHAWADVWNHPRSVDPVPGGAMGRELYQMAYNENYELGQKVRRTLLGIEVERHA